MAERWYVTVSDVVIKTGQHATWSRIIDEHPITWVQRIPECDLLFAMRVPEEEDRDDD